MTATYIGNGDWIPGVPARDLSEEEYARHKDAIRENEAATGKALYVVAQPAWTIIDDIDTVDTVQED